MTNNYSFNTERERLAFDVGVRSLLNVMKEVDDENVRRKLAEKLIYRISKRYPARGDIPNFGLDATVEEIRVIERLFLYPRPSIPDEEEII
jgi:hypothetical protein